VPVLTKPEAMAEIVPACHCEIKVPLVILSPEPKGT
jgi:hypothetical protein